MMGVLEQLNEAVNAVRIVSSTSFTWFDTRSPRPPVKLRPMFTPKVARAHLHAGLRDRLYEDFYCSGYARPTQSRDDQKYISVPSGRLALAMSHANCGLGSWDADWVVRTIEAGFLAVQKNGLELWVRPQDCLAEDDPPKSGQAVSIRLPKESFELSPGYYCALSDQPFAWNLKDDLVRLYMNLRPDQSARAVAVLTGRLNAACVPYRLKVLNDEQSYRRCDTAVLYLRKQDYASAIEPFTSVVDDLCAALRPAVPAMTKQLAPGIGFAEDPGPGSESFGQHRCSLIAEGLIQAHERRKRALRGRLDTVLDVFRGEGIDPQQPYLNPGSLDHYALSSRCHVTPGHQISTNAVTNNDKDSTVSLTTSELLEVAERIGYRLTTDAVWHADRCTWLGLIPAISDGGAQVLAYGGVGSELYDGTSGIAVFLAMLAVLTGNETVAKTARAATRQALDAVAEGRYVALGLYNGAVGISLSAVIVARLIGDDMLATDARKRVDEVFARQSATVGFDVISGSAGGVAGLLTLAALLEDDVLIADAVRLGEALVTAAVRSEHGWSWKQDDRLRHPNLTGLSHGAAGAAYALLELYRATGEKRWVSVATEAFRYERYWFCPNNGNWPDLRDNERKPAKRHRPSVFRTQWCHGAPGIALTRLRAIEILDDAALREEAAIAIATTVENTEAALLDGTLDFSLCHGLAGNADVLLDAVTSEHSRSPRAHSLVEKIAAEGRSLYALSAQPWPCGLSVPGRESPGLMLGLAGIGYYYLRLAYPSSVPSVLLLRPERTAADLAALVDKRTASSTTRRANLKSATSAFV
jgi:hypothetical protein